MCFDFEDRVVPIVKTLTVHASQPMSILLWYIPQKPLLRDNNEEMWI